MQTKNKYILNSLIIILDLVIINACYLSSLFLIKQIRYELLIARHIIFLAIFNIFWIGAAGVCKLYRTSTINEVEKIYRATLKTTATLVFVFITCLSVSAYNNGNKWLLLLILTALLSTTLTFSRFIFTIISARLQQKNSNKLRVGVLGNNNTSIKLTQYFTRHTRLYNYTVLAGGNKEIAGLNNEGWYQNLIAGIKDASVNKVQELYVCLSPERMLASTALMTEAEEMYIRLMVVPDIELNMSAALDVQFIQQFPVFSLPPKVIVFMKSRAEKRLFDFLFSLMVIIFLLSWLYPLIALIIKLQSKGPVLFRQQRSGRNNNAFCCYKFRTMQVNTESDKRQASRDDDRITAIGKFLRRSSLDELPQFFNVLKGEMSVVGPRPHMLAHTSQYQAVIDSFMVRHAIKPGITGLAQIHGFRGQTTEDSQMADRLDKDLEYIKKWSFMLDIRIIFLTFFISLKGQKNAF